MISNIALGQCKLYYKYLENSILSVDIQKTSLKLAMFPEQAIVNEVGTILQQEKEYVYVPNLVLSQ